MNEQELQMKSEVMKRVKSIHYMRTVVRPFLVKSVLLVLFVSGIASLVSISSVISNMVNSPTNYFAYIFESFLQTGALVQMMLVVFGAIFILWMVDVIKGLKNITNLKFKM